jgi:WD40 repeat protein
MSGRADADAVAFSPDGRLVVTGTAYSTAQVWEAASGKLVATLSEHTGSGYTDRVLAVAFSPDGRFVLTLSDDGTARRWPMLAGTQSLIESAKSIVPRCLTLSQRQRFHLVPDAPRWCYSMQLWPFDDPIKNPPPIAWDERLIAAWDWLVTKTISQSTAPKAGRQ